MKYIGNSSGDADDSSGEEYEAEKKGEDSEEVWGAFASLNTLSPLHTRTSLL